MRRSRAHRPGSFSVCSCGAFNLIRWSMSARAALIDVFRHHFDLIRCVGFITKLRVRSAPCVNVAKNISSELFFFFPARRIHAERGEGLNRGLGVLLNASTARARGLALSPPRAQTLAAWFAGEPRALRSRFSPRYFKCKKKKEEQPAVKRFLILSES